MGKTIYTETQDRWLNDNVNAMGRRWDEITLAFNSTFGTSMSKDSLRRRTYRIMVPFEKPYYTDEQCKWIVDHSYLPRSVMKEHFSKEFGVNPSVRSLERKCANLKAYKLFEVTNEHKQLCIWTDEIDAWLKENTRLYRDDNSGLVKALNHRFGTRFTVRAVNHRRWKLRIKLKGFYRHEDEWLLKHKDINLCTLTYMFNDTFFEHRSEASIEKHLLTITGRIRRH